jgi:hypothetical protein
MFVSKFESKDQATGKPPLINHFIDSSGGGRKIWNVGAAALSPGTSKQRKRWPIAALVQSLE